MPELIDVQRILDEEQKRRGAEESSLHEPPAPPPVRPARTLPQGDMLQTQAQANLTYAATTNSDKAVAAKQRSRKDGIPFPLAMSLDNRDFPPPDAKALPEQVQRFYADDPANAMVEKNAESLARIAEAAGTTPEQRRADLELIFKTRGYDDRTLLELRKAGWTPADGGRARDGRFYYMNDGGLQIVSHWPVPEDMYLGEEEAAKAKELQKAELPDGMVPADYKHRYDNLRIDTQLAPLTADTLRDYANYVMRENAAMKALFSLRGDSWHGLPDAELENALRTVQEQFGINTSDLSVNRLREVGVGGETNVSQALNLFGVQNLFERRTRLNAAELAAVSQDLNGADPGDLKDLIMRMEEENRQLRGSTFWNTTVEGLANSVRFGAELFATGGVANVTNIIRGGWRALPKNIWNMVRGEAARLPAYGPTALAQAWGDVIPRAETIVNEGKVELGLSDGRLDELGEEFFNRLLDTYIENVSERAGALFPGLGQVGAKLSPFVPKAVKNAAFITAVRRAYGAAAKSRGGQFMQNLSQEALVNGFIGEVAEEKIGDAMRALVTGLARQAGVGYGDLGQDGVFGTAEQELQMTTQVALGLLLFRMGEAGVKTPEALRILRFSDAQKEIRSRMPEDVKDPETMEDYLANYAGGKKWAYISSADAQTLFQTTPELQEQLGVTDEIMARAETDGRMIPVDLSRLQTRVSDADFERVLPHLAPDADRMMTVKEAKEIDFSAEAVERGAKRRREWKELESAFSDTMKQLMALDRPINEIRSFSRLLSMARYFGEHSSMTAAEWIRNIKFQSMTYNEWLADIQRRAAERAPEEEEIVATTETVQSPVEETPVEEIPQEEVVVESSSEEEAPPAEETAPAEEPKKTRAPRAPQYAREERKAEAEREAKLKSEMQVFESLNEAMTQEEIQSWFGVVQKMASKMRFDFSGVSLEEGDLALYGLAGVARAVKTHDKSKGPFRQYARRAAWNAMLAEVKEEARRQGITNEDLSEATLSIDTPINEEGGTIEDTIADTNASALPREVVRSVPKNFAQNYLTTEKLGVDKKKVPAYRAVWTHMRQGETPAQIAKALEIDPKTAAKYFGEIRDLLKTAMGGELTEEVGLDGNTFLQVAPVYTGSAADYEKPSLHYVGSGEGAQVFGWGLYGSSSENVARWYAKEDARRKSKPRPDPYFVQGITAYVFGRISGSETVRKAKGDFLQEIEDANSLQEFRERMDVWKSYGRFDNPTERDTVDSIIGTRALEYLDGMKGREFYSAAADIKRNLYKQTFWPDKQENLIDWDGRLTQEQAEQIIEALKHDDRAEADGERSDAFVRWFTDENGLKYGKTISREYLEQFTDPERDATIEWLYNSLVDVFGSPKEASEFLYRAGIDGITYIGDSSGVRNYVAFSDQDIRVDEHVQFQATPEQIRLGATQFGEKWDATVTLFENANASTLVHELGHYTYEMMAKLVEAGMADERMQNDFTTLTAWMNLAPEEAERGYQRYLKSLAKNEKPMTREAWEDRERREKIARGFEAYILRGEAPTVELAGAFATLRKLMLHVYRSIRALGVTLSDEVIEVFDGMLSTEALVESDSILENTVADINMELLGMSRREMNVYQDLIVKAKEQAAAELTAAKARELDELKPQWREEIRGEMGAMPVYKSWEAARKAPTDRTALEALVGGKAVSELRKRGLVGKKGEAGLSPMEAAAAGGYATVEQMVDDILAAETPTAFMSRRMLEKTKEFNENFSMTDAALSTQASLDVLDRFSVFLARKSGQSYQDRRQELRKESKNRIMERTAHQILNGKKMQGDSRRLARELVDAFNKEDYATAFDRAKQLRGALEELRWLGDAQNSIRGFYDLMKRARHARRGTIDGTYQDALYDLSVRLGMTRAPKRKLTATVFSAVDAFNREAGTMGREPLDISGDLETLLNNPLPWPALTLRDILALNNLAKCLNGTGRELVSEARRAWGEAVNADTDACAEELKAHGNSHREGEALDLLRSGSVSGVKLRNIFGFAAKWKEDSAIWGLYRRLYRAASRQTQLYGAANREATKILKALEKSSKGWNLDSIRDIRFPDEVERRNYRKWDAEKVLAACLNMGTLKNRQRLADGYEWGPDGEANMNRIAALLSAEDWQNVQRLWDLVGQGELSNGVRDVFRRSYHYDMSVEEAAAFTVTKADGTAFEVRGGYYPLAYIYSKNDFRTVEVGKPGDKNYDAASYRRPSFTQLRSEQNVTNPVRLSLNVLRQHLFDAAHYIAFAEEMSHVLTVVNKTRFAEEFRKQQGFERYKTLKALLENVAQPSGSIGGTVEWWERWSRAALSASGLYLNPVVMAIQVSSAWVGIHEMPLEYFHAISHPSEFGNALKLSYAIRDRFGLKDIDLKALSDSFAEGNLKKTWRFLQGAGFVPMQFVDLGVAITSWNAAYLKATGRGMTQEEAVAEADEFVARTQGSSRAIDMSRVQLSPGGRVMTVFYSQVSAMFGEQARTLYKTLHGHYGPVEAALAVGGTLIAPYIAEALIRATLSAGGDDDEWDRVFWQSVIAGPFSGIPLVRDVADAAARKIVGAGGASSGTPSGVFRAVGEIWTAGEKSVLAASEGDYDVALYQMANALGIYFRVPVIRVYERMKRLYETLTGEGDSSSSILK